MNKTNETISNIKTLKLYAWTAIFEQEIKEKRERELNAYAKIAGIVCLQNALGMFFPNMLYPAGIATYIGTGHHIGLADAFAVFVYLGLI